MNAPVRVAAFDFDGTLARGDSMYDFARFALGSLRYFTILPFAFLRVALALAKRPADTSAAAKEAFLGACFGGRPAADLQRAAAAYADRIDTRLDPWHRARLEAHLAAGEKVAVISASARLWLAPWADRRGLLLAATELESEGGRLTGRLGGPNMKRERKVEALRRLFPHPVHLTAYGNSEGDHAMLLAADEAWYCGRPFRADDAGVAP